MSRDVQGSGNVSMAMRSQDSMVNDETSQRMAAIIAHSAESIPEYRVRLLSSAYTLCDGRRYIASVAVLVIPGRCGTSKYQGSVR